MDSVLIQTRFSKLIFSIAISGAIAGSGCQTNRSPTMSDSASLIRVAETESKSLDQPILQTAFQNEAEKASSSVDENSLKQESDLSVLNLDENSKPPQSPPPHQELTALEATAVTTNPQLMKLQQQVQSASARARYQDALPDPTISGNIFGLPIETASGSQRANLTIMQMIPWLDRLDAQRQQACYEAMVLTQKYQSEKLRVVREVRVGYYHLFILHRQIETIQANQELLTSLIEIANSRIATGQATQGDVLLGTLELSRLEKQLITLRQQMKSAESQVNRLLNRRVDIPIGVPEKLEVTLPEWTHESLVSLANQYQPRIAMTQLQSNASRWSVEVAELRRKPDFQVGASWYFIEGNRPSSSVVDVGQDAFSIGASMTIPIDQHKYDAIRDEALWKHAASASSIIDVRKMYEAQLLDLLEQARASQQTARLYRETIIPQSEQTLNSDQEALINGTVEFDRVIQDFRNLLTLEFEYHRSIGNLASIIARIEEATGTSLPVNSRLHTP